MAKQPTKKEQKFVKEYVKTGNGTAAALASYAVEKPKQAATIASKNLQKPKVQSMLQEELKRQNITLERALEPISKALTATMTTPSGEVVDDLDTQLKGSDRALKLLIEKPQNGGVNFNLNIDSAHFGGEFVIDSEVADEE